MANTSKRGFASMDPGKQREIASKGGRAAHAKGTAHEFTSDEARVAGRKGGEAVSRDRAHMSAIGREGGHSRGRTRQQPSQENINSGAVIDNERASFGLERANDRGAEASGSNQRNEREPNRNENASYPNR
ncbi:MAG: KGG domain-containing protein [Acidobacteriota bacterium]|nr:KGG domain-containing protein [Acidobacteriota bacterium]